MYSVSLKVLDEHIITIHRWLGFNNRSWLGLGWVGEFGQGVRLGMVISLELVGSSAIRKLE